MRRRNTESIGEVLRQYFDENPFIKRKVAESRAVSGWKVLLGKSAANYTTSVYLRNGVLYVQLTSAVLRSELQMAKEMLKDRLNQYAGMQVINDIVLR